jgi:4'-phosphopantetheinyl transferase
MIYIYDNVDLDETRAEAAYFLFEENVAPGRWEYANRFKKFIDRWNCVMSYMLLRYGLKKEYGIDAIFELEVDRNGKPHLPASLGLPDALDFSLAHCRGLVACAICECPVGIDVEDVKTVDAEVVETCFSEREKQQILSSIHQEEAFATTWTRKEAILKHRGVGLIPDMKSVNTLIEPNTSSEPSLMTYNLHTRILSVCGTNLPPKFVDLATLLREFDPLVQ